MYIHTVHTYIHTYCTHMHTVHMYIHDCTTYILDGSVSKGEETDKHKFIVKLVPESVSERTYYIALAAKHELEVGMCVSMCLCVCVCVCVCECGCVGVWVCMHACKFQRY